MFCTVLYWVIVLLQANNYIVTIALEFRTFNFQMGTIFVDTCKNNYSHSICISIQHVYCANQP